MRHTFARIATPLILLSACATAASRARSAAVAGEITRPDSVIVKVSNRSDRTLTISLARADAETRLGDVAPGSDARFALRAAATTGVPITLVATASHERLRTVPFKVQHGQIAWFEIVPELVGSRAFALWPPR